MIYGIIRWSFARPKHSLFGRSTRGHFLDGIALFPMLLLAICPIFPGLATTLVTNDAPVLAIAGIVAILAVLEPDRFREHSDC